MNSRKEERLGLSDHFNITHMEGVNVRRRRGRDGRIAKKKKCKSREQSAGIEALC